MSAAKIMRVPLLPLFNLIEVTCVREFVRLTSVKHIYSFCNLLVAFGGRYIQIVLVWPVKSSVTHILFSRLEKSPVYFQILKISRLKQMRTPFRHQFFRNLMSKCFFLQSSKKILKYYWYNFHLMSAFSLY